MSSLEASKLFYNMWDNNQSILQAMLGMSARANPDGPNPLLSLRCTAKDLDGQERWNFMPTGDNIDPVGLTLFEYGTALCNAGKDRHAATALFAASASSSAATTAAAATFKFEPGQRYLHVEKGLLYVQTVSHDAVNGHQAVCKQFCRNNKTCTVAVASLIALPPAPAAAAAADGMGSDTSRQSQSQPQAAWLYANQSKVTFSSSGQMGMGLDRYSPDVEVKLEAAYQQGLKSVDISISNQSVSGTAEAVTVDLVEMAYTNHEVGGTNIVLRQVAGSGAGITVPLSILELEAAVNTKSNVQVRGKGLAQVLFVMDSNAKVLLAEPPNRKTFASLDDIFAEDADLDADARLEAKRIDFDAAVRMPLADAALAPLGSKGPQIKPTEFSEYLANRVHYEWQYMPGTTMTRFPGSYGAHMFSLFAQIGDGATAEGVGVGGGGVSAGAASTGAGTEVAGSGEYGAESSAARLLGRGQMMWLATIRGRRHYSPGMEGLRLELDMLLKPANADAAVLSVDEAGTPTSAAAAAAAATPTSPSTSASVGDATPSSPTPLPPSSSQPQHQEERWKGATVEEDTRCVKMASLPAGGNQLCLLGKRIIVEAGCGPTVATAARALAAELKRTTNHAMTVVIAAAAAGGGDAAAAAVADVAIAGRAMLAGPGDIVLTKAGGADVLRLYDKVEVGNVKSTRRPSYDRMHGGGTLAATPDGASAETKHGYLLVAKGKRSSSGSTGDVGNDAGAIVIASLSDDGVVAGCHTILQSVGTLLGGSSDSDSGNGNGNDGGGGGAAAFPACYIADAPSSDGRYRRCAVAVTTQVQTLAQFIEFANVSRSHMPSMSRGVQLNTTHSRADSRYTLAAGFGLCTLLKIDQDNDDDDAQTAVLQVGTNLVNQRMYGCMSTPEIVTTSVSDLYVPVVRTTGVDWSAATFVEMSGGGKGGVLFLEFPRNRLLVSKRTDEPFSELAAFRLAQQLNVRTPGLAIISKLLREGAGLMRKIKELSLTKRFKHISKGTGTGSLHASPFLSIQEIQLGSTLKDICNRSHSDPGAAAVADAGAGAAKDEGGSSSSVGAPAISWAEATFGVEGALTTEGETRLATLGRIIAFDILTHNSDRFYLEGVFDNFSRCGNVGNIMFDLEGNPAPIDNTMNCYDRSTASGKAKFEDYKRSIAEVLRASRAEGESHPALNGIRRFFIHGQGVKEDASYVQALQHDIGEAGTHAVERGFLQFVEELKALGKDGLRKIMQQVEESVVDEIGYMVEHGESILDMPRVDATFLSDVATAMTL